MNTHESYVSLETAKMLKKAGFDWGCEHCYFNDEFDEDLYEPDNFLDCTYQIAAPTLASAQRWLREVKNMSVEVLFEKPGKWSCGLILDTNKGVNFENFWREEFDYDIYEQALEAGIQKALEIIINKGE